MRKSHLALELSLGHPLLISSYFKLLHQDPAKTKSAASDARQQCGMGTSAASACGGEDSNRKKSFKTSLISARPA